ncbi:toll-like receptor 13 [Saccostrea cucullata]|uniref:toll-like receptor 13 n=1 Tax=Saccostrea cuccullata TaxID=36930 RepID=UPI002ED3EDE4
MNISSLHLTKLVLIRNAIHKVDKCAFELLPRLQILDLCENGGPHRINLKTVFYGLQTSPIQEIYLVQVNIYNVHEEDVEYLRNTSLKFISLDGNKLKSFNGFLFSHLTKLQGVSLENNRIKEVHFNRTFRYLKTLVLKKNKIPDVPVFCCDFEYKQSCVPNLESLDLSFNLLIVVKSRQFRGQCLPNLKSLKLGHNKIKTLGANLINRLPSLLNLSIDSLDLHVTVAVSVFNSTSLRSVTLANNVNFFTDNEDSLLFYYCPNLEELDLTSVNLYVRSKTNKKIFNLLKPLRKIQTMLLDWTSLSTFPSGLFSWLPELAHLSLQNCKFHQAHLHAFAKARIKRLQLDGNLISTINDTSLPSYAENIGLRNNPFQCNCDLEWFRNWIIKNHQKLIGWPNGYVCSSPKNWEGKKLKSFHLSYSFCHPLNPYIIIAIGVGVGTLIIVSSTIILYRNRWNIKYYLYLLRAKRRGYQNLEGHHFLYDAFVAYNSKDRVWVISEMIPRLEKRENLKLCLHDRDFEPGKFTVDNITDCIRNSRKILIILSNNFVQNHWCRFEILLAQSLYEDNALVIVVVLEEILTKNMSNSLHVLMKTTTFIEWIDDVSLQEKFWERLVSVVKS